ncbi:YcaO-like family protein [Sporosarcina limicola]|uniref:YcaO domain-containing protein n=1 Tax=Sporosarcina limicola TaxID=34101 RepID=A0A927MG71_9BACL|nr:YcaO-like family protein [Sporosarcina limicola]MBE1553288.1 hypothetical protein [Sporosarcina limicola]
MYSLTNSGIPFLIKELSVFKSLLREAPIKVSVIPSYLEGALGSATHFGSNRVIKAAFGEQIERTSLYLNAGNFKNRYVKSFDLRKFEESYVPLEKIVHCYHTRVLEDYLDKDTAYNDSCGVASHIRSFETINSAFLEFFERQSLIHNWLTESPGKQIDLKSISSEKVIYLIKKAKNFIDDIYFFDISLHPDVSVILTLGFGERYMGMGISANWGMEKAIVSSLEEFFEFFSTSPHKDFAKSNEEKSPDYEGDRSSDPHFYAHTFFSTYDSKKLREVYSYLFDKSKSIDYCCSEDIDFNYIESIRTICTTLNLDIQLVFIPSVIKNLPTKIVKVVSLNGYPHMLTTFLEPTDYIYSSSLNVSRFPNRGRALPFP